MAQFIGNQTDEYDEDDALGAAITALVPEAEYGSSGGNVMITQAWTPQGLFHLMADAHVGAITYLVTWHEGDEGMGEYGDEVAGDDGREYLDRLTPADVAAIASDFKEQWDWACMMESLHPVWYASRTLSTDLQSTSETTHRYKVVIVVEVDAPDRKSACLHVEDALDYAIDNMDDNCVMGYRRPLQQYVFRND